MPKNVQTTAELHSSHTLFGVGTGNPLQYSCLENPMDSGAWLANVHKVAQSWIWLTWLSTHAHTSKVMLKILQARFQQYVNWELPDVLAGFRKGRGTRDQITNIRWIIKKARELQKKKSISASLTTLKSLICGLQQTVKHSSRDRNTRPPYLPPEKPVCRSRSNQM